MNASNLLENIRDNRPLGAKQQRALILLLSWPAILAQISVTIMQLIDAGMVGQLGTAASASIGLVSSTTWLINGICSGAVFGFSVQTSQAIGARSFDHARNLCRQGLLVILALGLLIGGVGASLSFLIPVWLGGEAAILQDAGRYLQIYCLALPFSLLNSWAVSMLQAAGDTKLPGLTEIIMCVLDVFFNGLFIYGLQMGVAGAALGTAASVICASLFLGFWTLKKNSFLKGSFHVRFHKESSLQAFRIGLPISAEQLITGSSYVAFTRIVSSLGTLSIAANSFAITAESLCYMPAYGCASASSAIIGQCIGAGREDLARTISWRITRIGIGMMAVMGVLMYLLAYPLMSILSPAGDVRQLGAALLRLEALAEPLYGASIVITGILRGKGDTLWPACLNFLSIWCIRIPAAAILARFFGLFGAWIAMSIELDVRGLLFLWRLTKAWKKKPSAKAAVS